MHNFPLSLENTWLDVIPKELTKLQHEWLFETGSLTQKLKQKCTHFYLKVLSEVTSILTAEQAKILDIAIQPALFREVLLFCDEQPHIYAQSWIPLGLGENHLTQMGNMPLGERIFKEPNLTRHAISVAKFEKNHPISQLACNLGLGAEICWARRSVFSIDEQRLLVCETFLPGSFAYNE